MHTERTYLSLSPRSHASPFAFLARALEARRQRRQLEHLSDDALCDLGLTRQDVSNEIAKPIWDVPAQWRRK